MVQRCNQPALRDPARTHLREIDTLISLLPASCLLVVAKGNWKAEGIGAHCWSPLRSVVGSRVDGEGWSGSGGEQEAI